MLRLLPILSLLAACGRNTAPESDLDVVPFVDPERYMGLWYEIAAFPIRSQEDCVGATATYSLKDNGDVEVFNQCFQDTLDGKEKSITGKAWIVDFDKCGFRTGDEWKAGNLARLQRSLRKELRLDGKFRWSEGDWQAFLEGYRGNGADAAL